MVSNSRPEKVRFVRAGWKLWKFDCPASSDPHSCYPMKSTHSTWLLSGLAESPDGWLSEILSDESKKSRVNRDILEFILKDERQALIIDAVDKSSQKQMKEAAQKFWSEPPSRVSLATAVAHIRS